MSDSSATLKEVFARALECASPAERDRYLTEACGGHDALRAEVEALLRAHARAGSFLGPAAHGDDPSGPTAAGPAGGRRGTPPGFFTPPHQGGSPGAPPHIRVVEGVGRAGTGVCRQGT